MQKACEKKAIVKFWRSVLVFKNLQKAALALKSHPHLPLPTTYITYLYLVTDATAALHLASTFAPI